MNKKISIVLFTLIIIALTALIVFTRSENPQTPPVTTTTIQEKVSNLELSSHNSKKDCWISYEGIVYDLTSFLPKHPGSAEAIIPYCGTSKEFEQAFSNQHGTSKVSVLLKEGINKGELE